MVTPAEQLSSSRLLYSTLVGGYGHMISALLDKLETQIYFNGN